MHCSPTSDSKQKISFLRSTAVLSGGVSLVLSTPLKKVLPLSLESTRNSIVPSCMPLAVSDPLIFYSYSGQRSVTLMITLDTLLPSVDFYLDNSLTICGKR